MDLNGDNTVNLNEFSVFASEWQSTTSTYSDIDKNGTVDIDDLMEFTDFWLQAVSN